jgi:pimeloyl-ACP methyl ester carboxylesterase
MAAAIFSACNIQNSLLYFPDASVPSEETLRMYSLDYWPARNDYRGFIGTNISGHPNGTVVVFHGNAATAADRAYYVAALAPLGYRVILAEYPAYGRRKGTLGETAFVQDGRETLRLAVEQFGPPVFLIGESLGAGVAAAIIKDSPGPINGILLITPWDTLAAIAHEKFPWLPVRLLLTDSYDTIGNLHSYSGRVAVVGAERDEIIPIHHAQALYDALPGPAKRMWTVRGAGHNNWVAVVNPSWWTEVMDFVGGH